jgi:amino acid permease
MPSTDIDAAPAPSPPDYSDQEKGVGGLASSADKETGHDATGRGGVRASFSAASNTDNTHRQLKSRHIQLIGIGGTIGTALYVCD